MIENYFEYISKIPTNILINYLEENAEDMNISVISDDTVCWTLNWGSNHSLVLEGKVEEKEIIFEKDKAIARLIMEDVIFMTSDKDQKKFKIYVICNDVFAWGSSDLEELEYKEIQSLYDMWLKDKTWGPAKWCCFKRNQKPQGPVVDAMKENGSWNDQMESLGENTMDKEVQDLFSYVKSMMNKNEN